MIKCSLRRKQSLASVIGAAGGVFEKDSKDNPEKRTWLHVVRGLEHCSFALQLQAVGRRFRFALSFRPWPKRKKDTHSKILKKIW